MSVVNNISRELCRRTLSKCKEGALQINEEQNAYLFGSHNAPAPAEMMVHQPRFWRRACVGWRYWFC